MLLNRSLTLAFALFSSVSFAALTPLQPTGDQAQTTLEILEKLNTKHYADRAVDDTLSEELLENYLDLLDRNRVYFLASDIEEFQQWNHTLDDSLKRGVVPLLEFFNVTGQKIDTIAV